MENLTVKYKEVLEDTFSMDIEEVFQVYQGNCSPVYVEYKTLDGDYGIAKLARGMVSRVKAIDSKDSQEMFVSLVSACNE